MRLLLITALTMYLCACGGGGSGSSDTGSNGGNGSSSSNGGSSNNGNSGSGSTGITVSNSIQFETLDQGLFGTGRPIQSLTFPPISLHKQSIGPETKGTIYENIPQDVPLSILQSAWSQAIATCRTPRSAKPVRYCEAYSYTPTQAQCESGSATLPSTVTINCCTHFGIIDTDVSYPGCAGGPFDGKADYSTSVPDNLRNVDLGAGIGPRPTQPAKQPFDIGAITRYQANIDAGLELKITTDAGSLDVSYATEVSLHSNAESARAGDAFTLSVRHTPIEDESKTFIVSRYPNINFAFQYFVELLAKLEAEYAHMGTDGKQKRATETILSYSTADQPDADSQGRLVGEIVGVEIGVSGAEVRIFANQPTGFPADIPSGVIWDFPLAYSWDITTPFTCPLAGVPKLGTYFCSPPPPVSTDVAEIAMRTPALNTPAAINFDGGMLDFASFEPLTPLRNSVAADGSLSSTTPSGFREILSIPGLGGLSSLDDILLDDGRLSTDWFRLDLDLDGLVALYNGGINSLGGNFVFGGNTVDPKTGKNKSIANMEWNMLDIDFANWFHVEQTLKFEPQLQVDLQFSQAVQVRENSSTPFTTVSQYTLNIAVDAESTLEIIQPAGGLTITPTYSLRNNLFTNKANMLWTPALQESILQVKIEGVLANLMAEALLPTENNLNFAVAQSTQSTPPVVMGSLSNTSFSLEGFQNVSGSGLTIRENP